ncbi:hypothetical protein BD410DRAFT_810028 [Rickenella mellea]|uniref:Chromatin elongation factor SPT5 n=1 Tax=Rickenella mellea TaxID=50990 RepID=A0A4Y7PFA2_9AGAM|nr:hypothetical protein BD410DRAFT_810028 [Rickenella mellea]
MAPEKDLRASVDKKEAEEEEEEAEEEEEDRYGYGTFPLLDAESPENLRHLQDMDKITAYINGLRAQEGRTSQIPHANDVPQTALAPTSDCIPMWMRGTENDCVFRLGARLIASTNTRSGISCVFAREYLPGRIYVECRELAVLKSTLVKHTDIFVRTATIVPVEERESLMRSTRSTLSRGSWIRFKRGLYSKDSAIVLASNENDDALVVAVTPRISLSGTTRRLRKRSSEHHDRPSPRLFFWSELVESDARTVEHHADGSWTFRRQTFMGGLLLRTIPLSHGLTIGDPSPSELERFLESGVEPFLLSRASGAVFLKHGDRVEITSSAHIGHVGYINGLENGLAYVSDISRHDNAAVEVAELVTPVDDIRRLFKVGDNVAVYLGPHSGKRGLTVDVSPDIITFIAETSYEEIKAPRDFIEFDIPRVSFKSDPEIGSSKRLINKVVYVINGPFKGYWGEIKDTGHSGVHVALEANHRTHLFQRSELVLRDNGIPLDGHFMGISWPKRFQDICTQYENPSPKNRDGTPPPSPTEPTAEDRAWNPSTDIPTECSAPSLDYPSAWLLCAPITSLAERGLAIVLHFNSKFERGTLLGRCGFTTQTSTPPPNDHINLRWTTNRGKPVNQAVHIKFLLPAPPLKKQKAYVFQGPSVGQLVDVIRDIRGGDKQVVEYVVRPTESTMSRVEAKENVCRVVPLKL